MLLLRLYYFFVSLNSSFNEFLTFFREYVKQWGLLLGFEDQTFTPINFLASTEKQLKWDADGLPSDKSAVKNAVIIDQVFFFHCLFKCPTTGQRPPLFSAIRLY